MPKYEFVAVDFDGTLCADTFPEVGEPKALVIDYVKRLAAEGSKIILYTSRENGTRPLLNEAVAFCKAQGIPLYAVNENPGKTFTGLKWDSGAKYSTHDRHLKEPLLEYTGREVESMSFSMFFSVFLGVNPISEVAKLLQAMRRGEVHPLIIGPKAYGTNKWVITKVSTSLDRYDNRGNLLVSKVSVTMKSYSSR